MGAVWTVDEAQVQLPQLIEDAVAIGPQTISRDGDALVIVVASREWDDVQKREAEAAASGLRLQDAPPIQGHLKNYICG